MPGAVVSGAAASGVSKGPVAPTFGIPLGSFSCLLSPTSLGMG